jgi:S-adenosylmethionine:tRNA ribosyltransferase-isomerase
MQTSDFDYELPPERIAQVPAEPRDRSRLMVLDRAKPGLEHRHFFEFGDFLRPNDLLVINRTRVIPARFYARKLPSGGKAELLLLRKQKDGNWEGLVGGKNIKPGTLLQVEQGPEVDVLADLGGSRRLLRFAQPIEFYYNQAGHMPLPPYIHAYQGDPERYQTVYNQAPGSAAAPTAGLHFTPQLLAALQNQGVGVAELTLHVGLDTFAPVTETDPREHQIHSEWCELDAGAAEKINAAKSAGGRVIAVGTTSVRTLESAAAQSPRGKVLPWSGDTRLYILPGYQFQIVDAMITNFHLPKSTLLMLVSAFAGRERILAAYQQAIAMNYRFFSFGDAMLLL